MYAFTNLHACVLIQLLISEATLAIKNILPKSTLKLSVFLAC